MIKELGEFFLQVKDKKASWVMPTKRVLVPNLSLGPNEEIRVQDELRKALWDFRSDRRGLMLPTGPKNADGHHHTFPYEPSVREGPVLTRAILASNEEAAVITTEPSSALPVNNDKTEKPVPSFMETPEEAGAKVRLLHLKRFSVIER